MTKKKDNIVKYLLVGVIVAIGILAFVVSQTNVSYFFGGSENNTYVINNTTQNLLNQAPTGGCSITFDKSRYTTGEYATVNIKDGANTQCLVFMKYNNTPWQYLIAVTTDSSGNFKYTRQADMQGIFSFVSLCGQCVTNKPVIQVEDNCWWKEVASTNVNIPPNMLAFWNGVLVPGGYRVSWNLNEPDEVNVIQDPYGIPSNIYNGMVAIGNTVFHSNWEDYGIEIINRFRTATTGTLKIEQWFCKGDTANWSPDILDKEPYMDYYEGGDNLPGENYGGYASCDAWRIAEGKDFYVTGTSISNIDECEAYAQGYCSQFGGDPPVFGGVPPWYVTRLDYSPPDCCIWDCSGSFD